MLKRFKTLLFFIKLVAISLFIIPLQSCKHDPPNINYLPNVCFSEIKFILATKCASCHSGHSGEDRGGFDANDSVSIINMVKPGSPWHSKLYTIVSSPNNPNMMPPKGKPQLSADDRTKIEIWILQGADQNPNCGNPIVNSGIKEGIKADSIYFAQYIQPINFIY